MGFILLIIAIVGIILTASYTKIFDKEVKKNAYTTGRDILKKSRG